ncbi:hypothetical protein KV564_27630 [Paenibacillus chitinolyticus]|nr:hypothetical protein [Paenibacillus chitinolyticus]
MKKKTKKCKKKQGIRTIKVDIKIFAEISPLLEAPKAINVAPIAKKTRARYFADIS